jgi:hypothetical protein
MTPARTPSMDRSTCDADIAGNTEPTRAALVAIDLGTEIVVSGDLLSEDPFAVWPGSDTVAADACIDRFAAAEADVAADELIGLGRVSGVRFPRLGGVLFGRVEPGSDEAQLLASAVERTIRAGYRTALAMTQVVDVPAVHTEVEDLWDAFVPHSYRVPRPVAATTWEVCRFDDFWIGVLEELGLEGDAARFANGHVSPLSRSIRGLSTVGTMLALAERGGRHDRRQSGRLRRARAHRTAGRETPRAPRAFAG